MTTISTWYTNQYSGTFRTSRLRAPSLVPQSRLSNSAQPITQQTLVVDAARNNRPAGGAGAAGDKDESKIPRRRETIFGPDVGEDDEPGWTQPEEGVKIGVDVIKGWVERAKSEEGLHATTTLQALVNLKRPTLLLQQLESQPQPPRMTGEGEINPATTASRPTSTLPTPPRHILKFNYDATTPLVRITLSIHPSPQPAVEGKESIQEDEEVKIVYSGTHEGGFNQVFTLPHSAAMDLSSAIAPMPTTDIPESAIEDEDKKDAALRRPSEASVPNRETMSEDTNRSSLEHGMGTLQLNNSGLPTVPEASVANPEAGDGRGGRLGRLFGRRNRREGDVEAGNIEMTDQAQAEGEKQQEEEDKEPEKGMRVLLRIEGVGAEGQPLKRRNAQLTHILINGMWVPEAGATTLTTQNGKRVWVVKVVRREAVIGAHTFLLKEIYGLSTASNQTEPSYPPQEADPYASTPNECIVCLTSPRDVVLLPCRHLVVCRECAVGMVEFGAGGKVARREEGGGAATEEAAGPAPAATGTPGATAPVPQVAGGTTTQGRERRKKKAKGWYCPVCRQPYTSLLRLALPENENANGKPVKTPGHSHHASRAPSIRSTKHSLRRVSSRATLPDGAEKMLDALRPTGAAGRDSDDEDDAVNAELEGVEREVVPEHERPQFVVGEDEEKELAHMRANATPPPTGAKEEDKKVEVEHREEVDVGDAIRAEAGGGAKKEEEPEVAGGPADGTKKGWKEV